MSLLLKTIWNRLVMYIFNQTSLVIICERPSPVTTHKRKKAENPFFLFFLTHGRRLSPGNVQNIFGVFRCVHAFCHDVGKDVGIVCDPVDLTAFTFSRETLCG